MGDRNVRWVSGVAELSRKEFGIEKGHYIEGLMYQELTELETLALL